MKITGVVLVLGFLALSTFAQDATDKAKTRVLILCTGNSARSQMSAGFLKSFDSNLDVYSAGTNPDPKINPYAVRAMQEAGIDISAGTPKSVSQFLDQRFHSISFQNFDVLRTHLPLKTPFGILAPGASWP